MKLLFVIVACLVAVAVAVPATKEKEPKTQTRTGKVLDDHVDTPGAGIAARWDKTKPKQNSKIVPQKEQGPFLYFREPRAHGYVAQSDVQIDGAWPVGKNWVGPRYRINKHARDDGEDDTDSDEDEQDDVDFQDDVSEEDQASFDTPSWDYLFPKHQTGQYARRNPPKSYGQGPSTYTEHGPTPPVQDAENSGYTLAVGSPGSPGYRGRSSPPGPWARQNKWAGKQVRYWTPVRGSKSYGRPERTPPSWYQGEGPVAVAYSSGNYPYGREQWAQRPVRGEREREVYYQSQYVPSPVRRRNWNTSPIVWGPRPKKVWNSAPVSVESDEEEVPQGQVPWGVQPQGPRRIKNWSKPQPWAHGQGRKQKYWGYY